AGRFDGSFLGARVDLEQQLPRCHTVPTLPEADDAHRVVDRVVLGLPPGAEVQRGLPDANGAELGDVSGTGCLDLTDDRRCGKRRLVRVASLRPDPSVVWLERGAVADRPDYELACLGLVNAQVGKHQKAAARGEHELDEVAWPLASERGDRLANLQRIPDRAAERLVHVRNQGD